MKKDYIKPQILMECMQISSMIAESNMIPFDPNDPRDADAKTFGGFEGWEDEEDDF